MAKDRPPSFQFYPRDYMADPEVQALTWEQRGRYHWGLCCSAMSDTPGIATEDQWRRWMALSPEEWKWQREAFIFCFRILPDAKWMQKRLASERQNQKKFHKIASSGGVASSQALTAEQRSDKARCSANARWDARRMLTDAHTASASALEESRINTLVQLPLNESPKAPLREKPTNGETDLKDWLEGFDLFWSEYPRKVAKEAARRAYGKIRPRKQETCDLIFAGLDLYKATVWPDRPEDKIEHAATWLNQRRFTDAAEAKHAVR